MPADTGAAVAPWHLSPSRFPCVITPPPPPLPLGVSLRPFDGGVAAVVVGEGAIVVCARRSKSCFVSLQAADRYEEQPKSYPDSPGP